LDAKSIFRYDKNGNEIELNRYLSNGFLYYRGTYKCDKYDEEGNWVVRTRNKEIAEIEYYQLGYSLKI
jgi:hypothetical protein